MRREPELLFPVRQAFLREEDRPDGSAERDHVNLAAPRDDQRPTERAAGLAIADLHPYLLNERDRHVASDLLQVPHAEIMS